MSAKGSFPLRIFGGLFEAKHRRRMKMALWTFGGLLDWQTTPDGWVWGGKPVPAKVIAERFGITPRQASRDLDLLAVEKYVEIERRSNGYRVRILNQKKFEIDRIRQSDRQNTTIRSTESDDHASLHSARARSDSTRTRQGRQAQLSLRFSPEKKLPQRETGRCPCGATRGVLLDKDQQVIGIEACTRCRRKGWRIAQ